MNNCNHLLPACYRVLGQGAKVPARTFFCRRTMTPWIMMERKMIDIDQQFARLEREMNSAFRQLGFPVPRSRPFVDPSASPEAGTAAGKPKTYSIKVDVGEGFTSDNIKINLKDRQLTINAKLEHKSENGNSRIYEEVSRVFTLPEGINPEEVKSLLTPEGILTIEAPLPKVELPQAQPKEIPITFAGRKQK